MPTATVLPSMMVPTLQAGSLQLNMARGNTLSKPTLSRQRYFSEGSRLPTRRRGDVKKCRKIYQKFCKFHNKMISKNSYFLNFCLRVSTINICGARLVSGRKRVIVFLTIDVDRKPNRIPEMIFS